MQKIYNYKTWKLLSDNEKEEELTNWDVYAGEGRNILKATVKDLEDIYKEQDEIVNIDNGMHHGGILVICIFLKKGSKLKVPKKYQGFFIMKSFK